MAQLVAEVRLDGLLVSPRSASRPNLQSGKRMKHVRAHLRLCAFTFIFKLFDAALYSLPWSLGQVTLESDRTRRQWRTSPRG